MLIRVLLSLGELGGVATPATLGPQLGCLRRTRAAGPAGRKSLKMKGSALLFVFFGREGGGGVV